jgi:hypothetical protein
LDVLLLHADMAFAGGKQLGKVFGNEGRCESWPFVEVATLDSTKES